MSEIKLKKRTLKEVFLRSVKNFKDNLLFESVLTGQQITYDQFREKVETVAAFLREKGVQPGDKVALLSENQPNWGVAYFAITTMGAIVVPIMIEFHENEIHHILRHSEAKAIFVSAKLYPKIENNTIETLEEIILINNFSLVPPHSESALIRRVISEKLREFKRIKDVVMKMISDTSYEPEEDQIAALIYTSGTTGHSKGVLLTHGNLVSDALGTIHIAPVRENDIMLSILPLSHTYECTLGLICPILAGSSVYYLEKPPTAAVMLPALKKVKPTIMLSVPLVIEKIFRAKILPQIQSKTATRLAYKVAPLRKAINKAAGKKLMQTFGGRLRMFCIGGAPIAPDVEFFLREAKFPYNIGYGLTETSPLIIGCPPETTRYRSTGLVLPETEVKLVNIHPETGEGEIYVKGPMVMKHGYYKDPEKTAEVLDDDGWFKTGDLAVKDSRGYYFIKGRSKNVIIGANGKNIYPEELESILNENSFVLESLVFERSGKLLAKIFLDYDKIDTEFEIQKKNETESRTVVEKVLNELQKEINARVAMYSKISKIFEQTEPFEKTPTQKIKRYLYI